MWKKIIEPTLFSKQEIPRHLWEPAITTGYRKPGISITDSIISVFQIHNETFNIWTHLIACAIFLYFLHSMSLSVDFYAKEEYNPLLCIFLTACLYTLTSAFAHTFNTTSEVFHHGAFMVDYFGISVYAFGSATATLAYGFPDQWRGTVVEDYFLIVNFISAVLAVYLSCKSRFRPFSIMSKLMRIIAFVLPYMFSMSPLLYRVVTSYNTSDATAHYRRHFIFAVLTSIFYASHFPEYLFPGRFDIYFHSHQIFHVCVSTGTYHQINGLLQDIQTGHSKKSLNNSLAMVSLLASVNAGLTFYFVYRKHCTHRKCNKVTGGYKSHTQALKSPNKLKHG